MDIRTGLVYESYPAKTVENAASDGFESKFWRTGEVRSTPFYAHEWAIKWAYPRPRRTQTEGPQIGDHRWSTSCGVVERPDHHCGDDLVFNLKEI